MRIFLDEIKNSTYDIKTRISIEFVNSHIKIIEFDTGPDMESVTGDSSYLLMRSLNKENTKLFISNLDIINNESVSDAIVRKFRVDGAIQKLLTYCEENNIKFDSDKEWS